ncbi:MAG: hypothetical protein JWR27_1213 [Aeromicrobium sp.]|nr:hypothetical protein [Aeromicrobium sp.]
MQQLDDATEVYCLDHLSQSAAQGASAEPVSNVDLRRAAVVGLVSIEIARKLAADEQITVKPTEYEVPDGDRSTVAKAFPGVDVDTAIQVIEDSRETVAIGIALAEKATGQQRTETNAAQLAQAGQAAIVKSFRSNDVTFAPRLGLSPSGTVRNGTGTLSVAPIDLEAPAAGELPDTQRCS